MSSRIYIENIDISTLRKIRKSLTIESYSNIYIRNKWIEKRNEDIKLYKIEKKYLYIPLFFSNKFLTNYPKIEEEYIRNSFSTTIILRENQENIYIKSIKYLEKYNTVTLNLYTGFGKTILSIYISSKYNFLTLIIYYGRIIANQWEKTINEFTNATSLVVKNKKIENISQIFNINFIICSIGKLNYINKEILHKIGFIIIDEIHVMCTNKRIPNLLKPTPKYIIACTATPKRNDNKDLAFKNICGFHNVYINDERKLTIYRLFTNIKFSNTSRNWELFLNEMYHNKERNEIVRKIVKENKNKKILILTWRIFHINILYNMLKEDEDINIIKSNDLTYNDSRVLISTISKIGTGFDEKSLCRNFNGKYIDLIIFLSTTSSSVLITQAFGRGRRSKDPSIIYFYDNSISIARHWKKITLVFPNAIYKELYHNLKLKID